MVVQGAAGAEVTAGEVIPALAVAPLAPLGTAVGTRVIVEGMAVTIPGLVGTQAAQIPVK